MPQDVFICYSPEDESVASDICNLFEQNNVSCWLKKRDFGPGDSVSKISKEIRSSNSFVLVYSKNAKDSNVIITEVDIAFSQGLPIIIFNLDDSSFGDKLEFYLKDKPSIDAYPNTSDYYNQLLTYTKELLDISHQDILKNDVFICYSDEDVLTADAICHVLEENNIKCWFKKRDYNVKDTIQKVKQAINSSKSMVLVYSQDAMNSNFVKTELEIAHSSNLPILSFNIDEDADRVKNLGDVHWLDAFPNPGKKFKNLILDTSRLVDKPVDNPVVSDKYENLTVDKKVTKKQKPAIDKSSAEFSRNYGIGKDFKRITIAAVVIMLAILLFVYVSDYIYLPQFSDTSLVFSDGGVSIEDYGNDDLNTKTLPVTFGELEDSGSNYALSATFEDEPDNFDNYLVRFDFTDDEGKVVDTTNFEIKDLPRNDDGSIQILDYDYHDKISKIYLTIFDENGQEVYYDDWDEL